MDDTFVGYARMQDDTALLNALAPHLEAIPSDSPIALVYTAIRDTGLSAFDVLHRLVKQGTVTSKAVRNVIEEADAEEARREERRIKGLK